ncbi:unnamed protein product, partial [Prorocentrum cordatum]
AIEIIWIWPRAHYFWNPVDVLPSRSAPVASSAGVQAAAGAGTGAAKGAGGGPAGQEEGVQGHVEEPNDQGRFEEPPERVQQEVGQPERSSDSLAVCLPAAHQNEQQRTAREVGPHLQAAGKLGSGAGAGAGQRGVPSVGTACEAASGCGLGTSPFGALEWGAKEAALAPSQCSVQAGEAMHTFDLDALDEGICAKDDEIGPQQEAAAAAFRAAQNKEKKGRKKQLELLDKERSLRRPGWEKD